MTTLTSRLLPQGPTINPNTTLISHLSLALLLLLPRDAGQVEGSRVWFLGLANLPRTPACFSYFPYSTSIQLLSAIPDSKPNHIQRFILHLILSPPPHSKNPQIRASSLRRTDTVAFVPDLHASLPPPLHTNYGHRCTFSVYLLSLTSPHNKSSLGFSIFVFERRGSGGIKVSGLVCYLYAFSTWATYLDLYWLN